jgi:tetratricopeptide (TPR) repeat protein
MNKLSESIFGPDASGPSELLQFLAESAYLWAYRGQPDKAIPMFEALTLLAPGDPIGFLGMAEAYVSQKKFAQADRLADQAARTERIDRRTLAFAYKLRGKALIQLNKPRDAEKALTKAIEMDAKGPEGLAAKQLMELATKMGLLGTKQ